MVNPNVLIVLERTCNCHHGLDFHTGKNSHANRKALRVPPPAPLPKTERRHLSSHEGRKRRAGSLIPKTFLLIEQICPRTSQIDNLGTTVTVLLQARAFEAVKGVTDSLTTADNTFVLVVAEGTFVTDSDQCGWAHVGVTHGAFAVAFVAEAADGDAGLLAAHDEIGVMARHDG